MGEIVSVPSKINSIMLQKGAGFSVNPVTTMLARGPFLVVTDIDTVSFPQDRKMLPKITEFIEKHRDSFKSGVLLEGWQEKGTVFLALAVEAETFSEAQKVAKRFGQSFVFDREQDTMVPV